MIKNAQKDMAQSDIFVCGKCHCVFHFIDLFKEHKDNGCNKESYLKDCRDKKPKLWSFLLWKSSQLNNNNSSNHINSWDLYQQWIRMDESIRETWVVAGKTILSFAKLGEGSLQGIPVKVTKNVVDDNPDKSTCSPQSTTTNKSTTNTPVFARNINRRANRTIPYTNGKEIEEQTVDKIRARRYNPCRNMCEFLVEWKGFPHYQNTWEPKTHLETCPELLETFEKQLALQREQRYRQAEKLIDKRFNPCRNMYEFFVKWKGLTHDQNTWKTWPQILETFADVEDVAVAKALIDKGANVNATDKYGRTTLHYANDSEFVWFLIEKGANVNAVDSKGMTPLHYAQLHYVEIAEILIENGANVNALDNKGRTPLHYENKIETVKVLLNNGANLNARDHEGKTPLFKFEMVQLKFVNNLDSYNNYDDSDLDSDDFFKDKFVSYNHDYIEIIRLLIEKGANIHCKDNSGSTVLHYAAKDNNYSVILTLLDLNAEVYCRNKNGITPLQIIFSNPRIKYYFLNDLISRGLCDVNLFQNHNLESISYDVYNENFHINYRRRRWMNFHDYLISIELANFHLEKKVLRFIKSFQMYNKQFKNECELEIKKLKCTKIDKINSYYDFIKMNDLQLEKYVRNKRLHEVLSSDNLKESFPIYSRIITVQYKKLLRRLNLLNMSIPVLLTVVGDFSKLPDYCTENILKYLDNDDLVNILQ